MLTFGEEVRPCSILAHIEVLPQLAARFKPEHGVVIKAIISEQDDATRLQHLKGHIYSNTLSCIAFC